MASRPDLAETNLPTLFPDASPEQLDRIRHATDRMQPAMWDWFEKNAAPALISAPGLHCTLIGTVELGEDDPVELELCIGRKADTAGVVVSATIGVSCWCQQNHNMHYVRDVEAVATSAEELATVVESATGLIAHWRETASPDAEWWRAEAGLPLQRA